jgi:hypothetical protein
VVYKLTCKKCANDGKETCYIGETCRTLGVRVKEHFYKAKDIEKRSEVCKHGCEVHDSNDVADWDVDILDHEARDFHRITKEALRISETPNCINKIRGIQVYGLN